MTLAQKIEAILFWKAEPVSIKKLLSLLNTVIDNDSADNQNVTENEIKSAIFELSNSLNGRGITLIQTEDEVMLGTAKEASTLIENLTKEELNRDLGKSGLETLSIILYQGPISRADIDYIRGVNSQFILRTLMIRGLIERVDNPIDSRSFLYKPTLHLLAHMGISRIEDLPDFEQVKRDIHTFKDISSANTGEPTTQILSAENSLTD